MKLTSLLEESDRCSMRIGYGETNEDIIRLGTGLILVEKPTVPEKDISDYSIAFVMYGDSWNQLQYFYAVCILSARCAT